MKIKHYAGYGCVQARKLSKTVTDDGNTTLVVEVIGDHERGIVRRDDESLVKRWLIDRFDKSAADISPWRIDYTVMLDYRYEMLHHTERAVYTFVYGTVR